MNKFFITILFLVSTLFANTTNDIDLKILKDLGIESSFIYNKSLQSTFDEYSSSENISYYNNLLRKSSLNAQIVRSEIESENIPDAAFFIPMLESSFVNQTNGKNSPGGLWQFIPGTATNLGLRNDEFIDERLDLHKSTDAASSYLKKYYKKFNKWYLALLAYNCGEGTVAEGVARASLDRYLELNPEMSNAESIKNYKRMLSDYRASKKGFSDLYIVLNKFKSSYSFDYLVENNSKNKYISEASLTYLKKIIVFSMIAERDLFKSIDKKAKYKLVKVKAHKGLQLKSLANIIDMNYNEFRTINKHIKKDVLPIDSKVYNIYIPQEKLDVYNQKIIMIKPVNEAKVVDSKVIKKVQDDKKSIKTTDNKKDNTSTDKKVIENKKNSKVVDKKTVDKKQVDNNKQTIYYIKKGDSLESIAKKYNVSLKKLKSDNNKKSNSLKIGEKIEINR
ncbi:MAG: transglycosylase SLT domain-containing protein [Aliarcobacter sp.]|nr:transglycosylase SLT domain-containing protein [Aliarcobacter sp.]